MSGPIKPEWDTPPHGDFASYVERLSAQGAAARPAAPPSPGMDKTVAKGRVAANAPPGLPPDLARVLARPSITATFAAEGLSAPWY